MMTTTMEELEEGELDDDDVASSQIIAQLNNGSSAVGNSAVDYSVPTNKSKSHKRSARRHSSSDRRHADKKEEHSRRKKKKSNDDEERRRTKEDMASYIPYMPYTNYPVTNALYPSEAMYPAGEEWSAYEMERIKVEGMAKGPYDSPYPSDDDNNVSHEKGYRIKRSSSREDRFEKERKVKGLYDSPSEDEIEFGIELNGDKSARKGRSKLTATNLEAGTNEAADYIKQRHNRHHHHHHKSAAAADKDKKCRAHRYDDDDDDDDEYAAEEKRRQKSTLLSSGRVQHEGRERNSSAEMGDRGGRGGDNWDRRKTNVENEYDEDFGRRGNQRNKFNNCFDREDRGGKKKLTDTPMIERPQCRFYMEGKCIKGDDCHFNHDFVPPRKPELCKYYVIGGCKKNHCVYYHRDWPCKQFHEFGACDNNDGCLYSHLPLTAETKLLPFRENFEDRINYCRMRKQNFENVNKNPDNKEIPSLLELEIYPEEENNQDDYNNSNYDKTEENDSPSNMKYNDDFKYNSDINENNEYSDFNYDEGYRENSHWNNQIDPGKFHDNYIKKFNNDEITINDDFTDSKSDIKVGAMINDLRKQTTNKNNQNSLMPPIPLNFSLPPPNFQFGPPGQGSFMSPNFPPTCVSNVVPPPCMPQNNSTDRFINSVPFLANTNMPPPSFNQSLLGPPPGSGAPGLLGPPPIPSSGLLRLPQVTQPCLSSAVCPPTSVGLLGPPPTSLPLQNFTNMPNQIMSNLLNLPPPFNQFNNVPNLSPNINQLSMHNNQISFKSNIGISPMQLPLSSPNIPISLHQQQSSDANYISPTPNNADNNTQTAYSIPRSIEVCKKNANEITSDNECSMINIDVAESDDLMNSETITNRNDKDRHDSKDFIESKNIEKYKNKNHTPLESKQISEMKNSPKRKISPIVILSPPYSPELIDQKPNDESYLEVSVIGKRVEYVLYKILVERFPTLPEDITVCNPKDPRLKKYRMFHHGIHEDSNKLMNNHDGIKRSPRPYSLPDIVFLTTPAAPILEDEQKKTKNTTKKPRLLSEESQFKFLDTSIKSPQILNVPLTPEMWSSPPNYKNDNNALSIEKSTKKPLDYRNDPRYKKEKSTDCDSALIPLICVHG